jgi:hypothetical protein
VASASFLTSLARHDKVAEMGCLVCAQRTGVDPAGLVPARSAAARWRRGR